MASGTPNVKTVFGRALEIDSTPKRDAYLDEVCCSCPEMRAEVEELLKAHQKLGNFLALPAVSPSPTIDVSPIGEHAGTVIGHYKLLQQIGEGGMGTVFMAEQLEPVKRRVALKIIKQGMDTRQFVARFEAERQALALMDHPNIARVLDAGCTETGRPYFVMELVKGIPINKFCDDNRLTAGQRLELFVSVCQVVQHAHQKGIIHRDLKPSNVLVALYDDRPVPKIIDFGVAKATQQQLTDKTLFTQVGQIVGTWEYMSPEQAVLNQLDVDTRTDIYSLGVILYELLTGVTPLEGSRLRSAALDEMLRLIREEEPPRPSTRVTTLGESATAAATYRGTSAPALAKVLRGDLDWIVMRALEKNRTRRYDTAKDLADDVQHYLADEPVEARAPSTIYRLQRFVRRYRGVAATVAAIAATLVVATVFSTWMAVRTVRANEQLQLAMDDANWARQQAVEEAEKSRKAAVDAETSFEMIGGSLGATEGSRPKGPDQGDADVLQRLEKRLDSGQNMNYRVKASVGIVIAKAYIRAGKNDLAEKRLRRAAEVIPIVPPKGDEKTAEPLLNQVASTWVDLAHAARGKGKNDAAERAYRQVLELWEQLSKDNPTNAWHREQVAYYHHILGEVLESVGQRVKAEQAYRRAFELHERLATGVSYEAYYGSRLVLSCRLLARLLKSTGRGEEAKSVFTKVPAIFSRLASVDAQWEAWTDLGKSLRVDGELSDAKDAFSHAMRLCERPGDKWLQRRLDCMMDVSDIMCDMQDWQVAETLQRQFLHLAEGKVNSNDQRVAHQRAMLVCALSVQGKNKDAESIREQALRAATPESQWHFWNTLGGNFLSRGKQFDANEAYRRALQLSDRLGTERVSRRRESALALGAVARTLRDFTTAEAIIREFIRSVEGQVDKNDPGLIQARNELAWVLFSQGREAEFEAIQQELLPILRRAVRESKTLMWWPILDRIMYADSLARTKTDETSLNEALQVLSEFEEEANEHYNRWNQFWCHAIRSESHKRLGQKSEALRHARLAFDKLGFDDWGMMPVIQKLLFTLLRGEDQLTEVESLLQKALAHYKQRPGDGHVITNYCRVDLAEVLVETKKYAEAEGLLQQAQKVLLPDQRVPASERQRVAGELAKLYEVWGKPEQASLWRAKVEKTPGLASSKPETKTGK